MIALSPRKINSCDTCRHIDAANKGKETSMNYISPIRRPPVWGLVGQVYSQIKHDFGVIADPFRLHSPVPDLLAGIWSATMSLE